MLKSDWIAIIVAACTTCVYYSVPWYVDAIGQTTPDYQHLWCYFNYADFIDDLTNRLLLSVFDLYSDDSEMYFFEPTCSSCMRENKLFLMY